MVNLEKNTEEIILNAAKKVFHRKGFEGARMQEIAQEAGLNKSLIHYYFRTKDKLFQGVFENAFTQIFSRINDIFHSEFTFISKIELFTNYYIAFLSENSYIPWFFLNCVYEKPDHLKDFLEIKKFSPTSLLNVIEQQVKAEFGVEVDPLQVYVNILSLCVFPVLAKPILQNIFNLDSNQLNTFYEQRKNEVPGLIINGLRKNEKITNYTK